MRSRAIVFVALVLVAVPLLADPAGGRPEPRRGGRHHHAAAAVTPPASALERIDQDQREPF